MTDTNAKKMSTHTYWLRSCKECPYRQRWSPQRQPPKVIVEKDVSSADQQLEQTPEFSRELEHVKARFDAIERKEGRTPTNDPPSEFVRDLARKRARRAIALETTATAQRVERKAHMDALIAERDILGAMHQLFRRFQEECR